MPALSAEQVTEVAARATSITKPTAAARTR
jgi:hypothetical protein